VGGYYNLVGGGTYGRRGGADLQEFGRAQPKRTRSAADQAGTAFGAPSAALLLEGKCFEDGTGVI
jgi:hypothetical protein